MRRYMYILIAVCGLGLIGISPLAGAASLMDTVQDAFSPKPKQGISAMSSKVQGTNTVGIELYQILGKIPGNIIFSPDSIYTALSMVYIGARGNTAAEMTKVLHLADVDTVVKENGIASQNQSSDDAMQSANSMWVQNGFDVNPNFVGQIKSAFKGAVQSVDYADEPATRGAINTWTSDYTNGRIAEIIPPDSLKPSNRLTLVNAVHLKVKWQTPFQKDRTRKMPFHTSAARSVSVDMMYKFDDCHVTEQDGFKLLRMQTNVPSISFVVLLPENAKRLKKLEKQVDVLNLNEWVDAANIRKSMTEVWLPKFTAHSTLDMVPALSKLGVKELFTPAANLSGIAPDLMVSAILHQADVTIDEEGGEAAAATAVLMPEGSAMSREHPRPIEFKADRPFLYMFRNDETGEILFMGRMENPAL